MRTIVFSCTVLILARKGKASDAVSAIHSELLAMVSDVWRRVLLRGDGHLRSNTNDFAFADRG